MKINNRLKKIADLVDKDAKVMDVGCDHALLDIYLTKEKKISYCIASDIKEGPLNQAKENIKAYQQQEKIELRLGNGLDVYTEDISTIIISGLGGKTMQGIFAQNLEKLKTIDTIILSPNNYQKDIRKFLTKHGYYIEEEVLIKEKKIIYQIIKFKKGKKKYKEQEYFFGPILLTKKNFLFQEFFTNELKSRKILLAILPKNFYIKRYKTKREIKEIEKVLDIKA